MFAIDKTTTQIYNHVSLNALTAVSRMNTLRLIIVQAMLCCIHVLYLPPVTAE